MVILSVRFASALDRDAALAIVEQRAPEFRSVPGLMQKFYGDDGTGAYTGIYLFDSQESLAQFRDSALAKSIPAAYQADEMRLERWEMVGALHQETPSLETV